MRPSLRGSRRAPALLLALLLLGAAGCGPHVSTRAFTVQARPEANDRSPVAVDVVLSDMAPNLSGIAATDQARSLALCELAVAFALEHLKPGGALLMKGFQGAGFPELLAEMRREEVEGQ